MMIRKIHIFTAMVLSMVLASCVDDIDAPSRGGDGGGGVMLTMRCVDMLPEAPDISSVASRGSDPKTQEEKEIRSLHLFFFDADDGTLLEPTNEINFPPYQTIVYDETEFTTNSVLAIPENAFTQMDNVLVVAIANINGTDDTDPEANRFCTRYSPNGKIKDGTRDVNAPDFEIDGFEKLKKWRYAPRLRTADGDDISELPRAGMPMLGYTHSAISLNEPNAEGFNRQEIQMTALMSRVDISVRLDPDNENLAGTLPTMTITGYGIRNMATIVPFEIPAAKDMTLKQGAAASEADVTSGPFDDYEVTLETPVTINKESDAVRFSYYTYENVQLPDYKKTSAGLDGKEMWNGETFDYPKGIEDDDRQRWKPVIARDTKASALTLKADYVTHQGLQYKAQFTVYMGKNSIDDFKVIRNHQYNNNITIKGLDYVRNSTDAVYTFDGRVNVLTDNPVYLAIVNERKVDAHASALPMDVWLLLREPQPGQTERPKVSHNSTVTVEIMNDPATGKPYDWIRMVMIPREEMENTYKFSAGGGCEPYFYTDLLDRIDDRSIISGHPGRDCGTKVEIKSEPYPGVDNSRSRVYFYIDENVPSTWNDPDYGVRSARIKIVYTNDKGTGDRRERILEIEQRALVKVEGTKRIGNTNHKIETYMEYYEEYLEHNDPLDRHEQPGEFYRGLPWGHNGSSVRRLVSSIFVWEENIDGCDVYLKSDAFAYTRALVANAGGIKSVNLYNEDAPASAAHYCWGRNKRTGDGDVPQSDTGWYLPGISELEVAIVDYFNTFSDFRGNFYWSSSCGKNFNRAASENRQRARATKLLLNSDGTPKLDANGNGQYENSENENDGAQLRTNHNRIRAFYTPNRKQ